MTDQATLDDLRERVRSWLIAFNARDREALFALFHPEMIYANDGAPLMRGVGEVQPWYEQAFQVLTARAVFQEEAIVVTGDTALVVGKFYFDPMDAAKPEGETGRVAMVWRRDDGGQWLLAFDMDNRPPDSVPADFAGAGEDPYLPNPKASV